MPHTEHRKKTLRKAQKREAQNRARRSAMRTAVKKARQALTEPTEGRDAAVTEAIVKLDKAGKDRLIHPNKAARMKSRLVKAKNRASAAK